MVQNNYWEDKKRIFYIPYWPQPGLIPRDDSRGTSVKSISFKGFHVNLHEYFFSQDWNGWINKNEFSWNQDSMNYKESENTGVTVDWHDYEDVDVLIAYRPNPRRKDEKRGFRSKPATKLYNAWSAGVPAILPNEYAYRQIRKSDLDYIEIRDPQDVKDAILKLKNDSALYKNMVTNGKQRAKAYTVDNIAIQWEYFLLTVLSERTSTTKFKISRYIPVYFRAAFRYCKRILSFKGKR